MHLKNYYLQWLLSTQQEEGRGVPSRKSRDAGPSWAAWAAGEGWRAPGNRWRLRQALAKGLKGSKALQVLTGLDRHWQGGSASALLLRWHGWCLCRTVLACCGPQFGWKHGVVCTAIAYPVASADCIAARCGLLCRPAQDFSLRGGLCLRDFETVGGPSHASEPRGVLPAARRLRSWRSVDADRWMYHSTMLYCLHRAPRPRP